MRAAVVGGGVAGTVSAIALARLGADVTVHEAYDDPAGAVGSFVSLAANGLRGLEAVGCLERVRGRGFTVPRQLMLSASGKVLGDVARGRTKADPMLGVTLMRADLVAELRDAARDAGVRVVTGERVDDPAGLAADLVVGADGIWSALRGRLDPAAPTPVYAGTYVVSGVSAPVDGVRPDTFTLTFARAGGFIHVPAPDGTIWWQAQVTSRDEPRRDVADDDRRRALQALYREELPAAVLAATTALHRTTLQHRLAPVPVWRRDNVVLVGDAAHPVGAGQGASMAIEDGLALATALSGAPSVAAGLAAFEAARRPRVTKVLKTSDENRDAKQAGPVARRVQEIVMPRVMPLFYERATAWLFDHRPEAPGADAAPLPAGVDPAGRG
jgi:salicylate hydroxylase